MRLRMKRTISMMKRRMTVEESRMSMAMRQTKESKRLKRMASITIQSG
jgi:hypothetical protein